MQAFVRSVLTLPKGEKKVLLHSCCAPCSGEVMESMTASGIVYTIFCYNSNIHPEKEYLLRKDTRVSPEWVAWANGTAVRELDFHDTFLATDYSHPGDNIPPILARQSPPASGRC